MQQSRVMALVLASIVSIAACSMAAGIYHATHRDQKPTRPSITVIKARPLDAQREDLLKRISSLTERAERAERYRDELTSERDAALGELKRAREALAAEASRPVWLVSVAPTSACGAAGKKARVACR